MTRFYLHLRNSRDIAIDEEGQHFEDDKSLVLAMTRAARGIMAADVLKGELDLDLHIDAENAGGEVLRSLPFSSVLRITPAHETDQRPLATKVPAMGALN